MEKQTCVLRVVLSVQQERNHTEITAEFCKSGGGVKPTHQLEQWTVLGHMTHEKLCRERTTSHYIIGLKGFCNQNNDMVFFLFDYGVTDTLFIYIYYN